MTSSNLLPDLRRDEGLRLHAYPDPLSGGEPFTIGYGHTGGVSPGDVWTLDQAEAALASDVAKVGRSFNECLPWWQSLDYVRQDVLVNMAFNMGVDGLLGFHNTLALIKAGNYKAAADNMLVSAWARQVGDRARRLSLQMRTGVHAGPGNTPAPTPLPEPLTPVIQPPPVPTPAPIPAPQPVAPTDLPFDLPSLAKNLWTMARDRLGAWAGGGVAIGGLAFSKADAILLVGLGVLILLVVLWWGARKEQHHQATVIAALNTAPTPPEPTPGATP